MSASNPRSKGELKTKLGKRKKDEEFIDDNEVEEDDYVESPQKKARSRTNQRDKSSHKVLFNTKTLIVLLTYFHIEEAKRSKSLILV